MGANTGHALIKTSLRSAGLISLMLLLTSRLLGLLRESAQAAAFGTSGVADAVVLMLTLPDWLTGFIAGGALSYVLLPLWARQSPAAQLASEKAVWNALLAFGLAMALTLWLARGPLLSALAPGLAAPWSDLGRQGLSYAALALPLALWAALWSTRAQYVRDFPGLYGANLVVNGVLIGALYSMLIIKVPSASAIDTLGWTLLLAMAMRIGWLGWRRRRYEAALLVGYVDTSSSQVTGLPDMRTWLWASLITGIPLALPFITRAFVSLDGAGMLAMFSYAWKLVELPQILAIQLAATLTFPGIAAAHADSSVSHKEKTDRMRSAFALAWTLACMATAALLVAAQEVALLLFGWGQMEPAAITQLAQWARIGSWCLLPQALIAVASTVLAAQHRLHAAAAIWGLGLIALLTGATAVGGTGTTQMKLLVAVLLLVAVCLLAALKSPMGQALPLRLMVLTAGGLAILAVAVAYWTGGSATGHPAANQWASSGLHRRAAILAGPLLLATLSALCMGLLAAICSADLRRILRR